MQAKRRASPAPSQSIDRFDRLVPARSAICRCTRRPKERTWSHNHRESGECRLTMPGLSAQQLQFTAKESNAGQP
jgi:hypothetical protein